MSPAVPRAPRIAIVSDPMCQSGGAERVVEAMAEAFPEAPIFSPLYCPDRSTTSIEARVIQSWLARFPGAPGYAKALLPLYPMALESFNLDEFDIIVSSHHTLAKGLMRSSDQVHISYCHTPMRALWDRPHDEIKRAPAVLRPAVRIVLHYLRNWDAITASRVDYFLANSRITRDRIATHYRRDSRILHPPIDIETFTPGAGEPGDYYLVAARNVPYKRIELAIDACERLERRLIVVGDRTDQLAYASDFVTFYGKVTDKKLLALMRGTKALLFPQREDFGMTPLELNACGRPAIAYAAGGALETVEDGLTGVLFDDQSIDGICAAIERFETLTFEPQTLRRHAEGFSKAEFIRKLRAYTATCWEIRLDRTKRYHAPEPSMPDFPQIGSLVPKEAGF
jgi:glycosyltransferase involved in cell wall biosynthesis